MERVKERERRTSIQTDQQTDRSTNCLTNTLDRETGGGGAPKLIIPPLRLGAFLVLNLHLALLSEPSLSPSPSWSLQRICCAPRIPVRYIMCCTDLQNICVLSFFPFFSFSFFFFFVELSLGGGGGVVVVPRMGGGEGLFSGEGDER